MESHGFGRLNTNLTRREVLAAAAAASLAAGAPRIASAAPSG